MIDWNKVRQSNEEYQREKFEGLPPIIKNFYEEAEHIANMCAEEARQIRRENNNIIVDGPEGGAETVPHPIRTFEDAFEPHPLILEQIYQQNFVKPSPIQSQAWPILLKGHDLIGIAQTGTGKTLAFLLPALIHIDNQPVPRSERRGPSALILSPTRELAQQIEKEINKINYKGIRSICVYGGGDRREQLRRVKQGVEIVVATPGRLNDFMMNGIINVTNVTYLVMDEADRMLDMGFEVEIKKVMLDIRPDRQTVMTSATWPPEVQRLADRYMKSPIKAFVGTLDLAAVHSVRQCVEIIEETEKKSMLLDFISQMDPQDKVIVFVGKKIVADDVSSDLAMESIMCQCIHGDREQCDRETALSEFKDGTVRILIATDVASRGLDVVDITHVINYDFPRHIEEYVHRIGRTGRAGRSGTSITFVTRGDWKSAKHLIDIMAEADQEIPDELVSMAERYAAFKRRRDEDGPSRGRGGFRGGRGGGRRRDDDCPTWI
ncbi:probable ATP-dependent RNA helicase DDX43 [Aplysia californica]|uniref:RNA helicase n=1 Tax=Aplysia californica TaxID=6500 RepID=A0ABM0JU45_APLCA|nr:probable ATP-dependent RNA helicase DDX43 [Aplysia californica]